MTQVVHRNDPQLQQDWIQDILNKEIHHNHTIIKDEHGTFRWEGDKDIRRLTDKMNLNDIIEMFIRLGYDKNSEIYRELYRNMGVSLYLYWEVFYWEANNPEAELYLAGGESIKHPTNIQLKFKPEEKPQPLNVITDFCDLQIKTMQASMNSGTPSEEYISAMLFAIKRLEEVKGIATVLKQVV
jgi:hypothetical protein